MALLDNNPGIIRLRPQHQYHSHLPQNYPHYEGVLVKLMQCWTDKIGQHIGQYGTMCRTIKDNMGHSHGK